MQIDEILYKIGRNLHGRRGDVRITEQQATKCCTREQRLAQMGNNEETNYGEQLYNVLFEIIGNKKNAIILESLRGENAVLTCLLRNEEELHPSELAEKLSLVPGRMTDILKTLEKKGMIRREPDPDDRRRVLVKITPKGIRDVTERREKVRTQYSGLYQALGLYDTVKLIELLKKLNRYIDEM